MYFCMMTSSNGNIFCVTGHLCEGNSPVPGEFPTQRPVTRSFDVFFELRLNEWLSKQSWGWWLETLLFPLWRHCNDKQNVASNPEAFESAITVVNKTPTEHIFCTHGVSGVRNNFYKPHRFVCECWLDISAWKSQVMNPTVLGAEANCRGAFA